MNLNMKEENAKSIEGEGNLDEDHRNGKKADAQKANDNEEPLAAKDFRMYSALRKH